jgi:hypothetical protein
MTERAKPVEGTASSIDVDVRRVETSVTISAICDV